MRFGDNRFFCFVAMSMENSLQIAGVRVTHLTHDSRKVQPGSAFFVLKGGRAHGADFTDEAVARGAGVIVTEHATENCPVPQYIVPDVREYMSLAAKEFFGNVADKMTLIAVVGTNGKTTCTYMLRHILTKWGVPPHAPPGIIGTLGSFIGDDCIATGLTTPDPIELHETLAEMYRRGVRTVIMEASAHAIHYRKLTGLTFRAAIFTNLSRDHLDFFETYEQYANTKIGFFGANVQTAVINADDPASLKIKHPNIVSYALDKPADFTATNLKLRAGGSEFKTGRARIALNLPGRFNVQNALACIAVAQNLGVQRKAICRALKTLPKISGRFNTFLLKLPRRKVTCVIDYAHTPDGLEKILTSVREFARKRIIAVFGCGGNRDTTKREIMGTIAARLADFAVITSDNPRFESPRAIMLQIEAGMKIYTQNYTLCENRAKAIYYALDMAQDGDMVVIAGKGGETYMEIEGTRHDYSDENVIRKYETTHTKRKKGG